MNKILSKFIVFLSFIIFFAFVSILVWGAIRSGNISSNLIVNKQMDEIKLDNILAKDFELFDLNGNAIKLSDYKGKLILLDFWSTWCPPCRIEAPELQKVYKEMKHHNIEFIGIAVWDEEEKIRDFIKEFNVNYPNLIDANGRVAIDYGVRGVPEKYLINREGFLVSKIGGPISYERLRNMLLPMID
tara:strand:+ start:2325 stop:2885 length:561 start_codon:yes stop_codon:yes gene_type:complete